MARRGKAYNYTRRIKKLFMVNAGADKDINPTLAPLRDGKYRNAMNMRLNSDGNKHAITKLYGKKGIYTGTIITDLDGLGVVASGSYVPLGCRFVGSYFVSFHASLLGGTEYPCIAVNGRVVLFSAYFPLTHAYPVQIDVNESAYGGEIFINNTVSTPMTFNVMDLVTEWNGGTPTTKYFEDFDINNHITQLNTPMDQPVFIRLENVGAVTGLPTGGYSYSIRYGDDDGNGTSWGPSTPIIPVVDNSSTASLIYRGATTYGKAADPSVNTKYGIHIRFRVTNSGDFSHIELRRVISIDGQSLETQPTAEKIVVSMVDIRTNPNTVVDFIDTSDKKWEAMDDFTEEELAIVEKANAIKYYDNRLTLHGPTYSTKIIDDTNLFLESERGNIAYPYMENLGDAGFSSIWNQVYRKAYMHGEVYGWALVAHDGAGGRAFAVEYKDDGASGDGDFTNYQIPNRREPAGLDMRRFSAGLPLAADVSSRAGSSYDRVHEVFDNFGTIKKDRTIPINVLTSVAYTYKPFTPTGDKSTTANKRRADGHDHIVTQRVRHSGAAYYTYPTYNPLFGGHGIYAQGMGFRGIDETKLPDHIKSFSIVRTRPANRVLCQGIGFYAMTEHAPNGAYKSMTELWFYSPDMDQNIGVSPQLFDEIINNPGGYQIQLISPVGFFSECFSGHDNSGTGEVIDMISYAKILYDDDMFNYGDAAANVGRGDGYVSFGRWRNTVSGSAGVESDTTEEFIFDIDGAAQNTVEGHEGRSVYLKLTVSSSYGSIYQTVAGGTDFDDVTSKAWQEPLYIVNIINNEAKIPAANITEYIDTGFHQKLKSIVGYSNGVGSPGIQEYDLVDERPDDCCFGSHRFAAGTHTGGNNNASLSDSNASWSIDEMVGYYIENVTDGSAGIIGANTGITANVTLAGGTDNDFDTGDEYIIYCQKYVFVDGQRWWALPLNTLFPAEYDACMVSLAANGYYDQGNYRVYGVCLCGQIARINNYPTITRIVFNAYRLDGMYPATTGYAEQWYFPEEGAKIEVRYDNRAALNVFGGDVTVGDALFVPIDSNIDPASSPVDSCFRLIRGFPYYVYQHKNIVQLNDKGPAADILVDEEFSLDYIRQMAVLFTCESRVNLPLLYNDSFPKKNYVQRPLTVNVDQWENGASAMYDIHLFSKEYEKDYGDEYLTWLYGGFHFPGTSNTDYSKSLIDRTSYNQPLIGFTERLYYPDRTIWSVLRKNPAELDSLRVFPALNVFDGSDISGPIRYAWASNTGKGDNIYKITDRGVCILLIDKNVLRDLVGGEVGIVGSSESFIQAEYWIRRDVGMNDGMWMSAAGIGNSLFFANTESVYMLSNNEITDIGLDYHSRIYSMLSKVPYKGGTAKLSPRGTINIKNEEYILCSGIDNEQLIFNYKLGTWVGESNLYGSDIDGVTMYCFDKYRVYFMIGVEPYIMGDSTITTADCYVDFAVNMGQGMMAQFKEIEIFSLTKPTSVQFGETDFSSLVTLSSANFGPYYLKDMGSFQNKIPRKSSGSGRFNKPVLFVRINYTGSEVFTLSQINIVANLLKLQ